MTDVRAIVDRMYADYLSNPTDTPVQAKLQNSVDATQTSIVYADELAIEEKDLLYVGSTIEMERELARVTDHDYATRTLTVTRGLYGTPASTHAATVLMRVSPKWPRNAVFEAVADEIVGLFPDLYAVGSEWLDPRDLSVELSDANAAAILTARQMVAGHYLPVECSLVRVGTEAVGSGVVVQYVPRSTGDIFITYSAQFARPTSEDDTLVALGVNSSWVPIVMFGALSNMLVQSDIDAATQEFITEALENQGFPPTTATSLAVALQRLRATHVERAARRLKAVHDIHTTQHQVI